MRHYKIRPLEPYSSLFVGVATDGRQVIADFYPGSKHGRPQDPPGPDMVAHWFNPEGDFLGYERRPIVLGASTPAPYPHANGDRRWQMLSWMAELRATAAPVEVKAFGCASGMYILDPLIDPAEYEGEFDFDYARETGRFDLYWQGENYIFNADGCGG